MGECPPGQDLGFRYQIRKNGDVEIHRHGRAVAILRGRAAKEFELAAGDQESRESQQLMARITGNYKRGNERAADLHPRNRR